MTGLILASLGAATLVFLSLGTILVRATAREDRLAERVAFAQRAAGLSVPPRLSRSPAALLARAVSAIGTTIARSGLLSNKTIIELEQTLKAAGFHGANGLGLFVGSKILLAIFPPVIAFGMLRGVAVLPVLRDVLAAASGIVGLLTPDVFVRSIRSRHLKMVERGLPDALDMMVICAESGLGLEAAISRVGSEIQAANPEVAEELLLTAREMQIAGDYRSALLNMGLRTGLEGLKRLGATLIQTIQYGTPLSRALRSLSSEMRGEMVTRFEERAARLPVLLTVPMILFILPCEFLIVAGPAMLRVIRLFHHH